MFVSVINLAASLGAIIGGWFYDLSFAFPLLEIGVAFMGLWAGFS